jgi:hypothetical protein
LYAARDYLTGAGGASMLWTTPIRPMLQTAFFTLLGLYVGGVAGRDYAFVGAVAFAAAGATISKATDVIVNDRWQGTMYRLRLARPPVLAVMLMRSPVYYLEGVACALTSAVVVGLTLIDAELTGRVLAAAPVLLVTTFSLLCLGMLVSAVAVGRRMDVLLGNAAAYLVLIAGGVVLPGQGWLAAVGEFLPLRHGLEALRGAVVGSPRWGELAAEAGIGLGLLVVAWGVLAVQSYRSRRGGFDDLD